VDRAATLREISTVKTNGEILAVAPSRGVTCKESRGVSGNALLWPGGVILVRSAAFEVRLRSDDFALAGAGERREWLVFFPLVRCL